MTAPRPTLTFADAAYAGAITGGPYDGVVIYIGGDAFHVWPVKDMDNRPERYRLPCWVRDNPDANTAAADANNCLTALHAYGVPAGALVAIDSETSVDPVFMRVWVATLNAAGHPVIDYGSESTVFGNANPDGYYWAADWTGTRHLAAGSDMTQYVSYANMDLSDASPALPFWDTRPPQAWTEFDMTRLPELRQGDADKPGAGFWYVRRLQALLITTGKLQGLYDAGTLTEDGAFGPLTAAAVRQVQGHYGIGTDGIAGPRTWSVLLTGQPQ